MCDLAGGARVKMKPCKLTRKTLQDGNPFFFPQPKYFPLYTFWKSGNLSLTQLFKANVAADVFKRLAPNPRQDVSAHLEKHKTRQITVNSSVLSVKGLNSVSSLKYCRLFVNQAKLTEMNSYPQKQQSCNSSGLCGPSTIKLGFHCDEDLH